MWPIFLGVVFVLNFMKIEFILFLLFFICIIGFVLLNTSQEFSPEITRFIKIIKKNLGLNSNIIPKVNVLPFKGFNKFGVKSILSAISIVCALWVGFTGFYWVKLNEEAVVLRFGAVTSHKKSGWYWKLPYPIERVLICDVTTIHKINTSALSDGQMLTKNENILTVFLTVFWRISDLNKYIFKATDPEGILKAATESVIRQVIAMHDAEECLTVSRADIGRMLKKTLSSLVDSYQIGVEIVDVQMGKIDPPDSVIDSYRDVVKAKLEKETKRNQAESYANFIIPKAKGEAMVLINKATEYQIVTLESAKGEYEAFRAKLQSYKSNPEITKTFMMFDTFNTIFANAEMNIVDSDVKVTFLGSMNNLPNNQNVPAKGVAK